MLRIQHPDIQHHQLQTKISSTVAINPAHIADIDISQALAPNKYHYCYTGVPTSPELIWLKDLQPGHQRGCQWHQELQGSSWVCNHVGCWWESSRTCWTPFRQLTVPSSPVGSESPKSQTDRARGITIPSGFLWMRLFLLVIKFFNGERPCFCLK